MVIYDSRYIEGKTAPKGCYIGGGLGEGQFPLKRCQELEPIHAASRAKSSLFIYNFATPFTSANVSSLCRRWVTLILAVRPGSIAKENGSLSLFFPTASRRRPRPTFFPLLISRPPCGVVSSMMPWRTVTLSRPRNSLTPESS